MDGALNAPWTQSAFAVFMGQSGIVSVDSIINGPLLTQGMQFAANGYTLVNNTALDALTLVGVPVSGGPNEAVIRVGDGTAGGTGYTATIAATLAGAAKLVKTDLGTLVLSGINTTPAARPSTAARCRSRRTATWAPWRARCRSTAARWPRPRRSTRRAPPRWARAGSFNVAAGTNFGITSAVGGSGALSKLGSGTLILGADNTYAGGTTISAGTLQLGSGAGLGHGRHPGQRGQQRHAGLQPQQQLHL